MSALHAWKIIGGAAAAIQGNQFVWYVGEEEVTVQVQIFLRLADP